MKKVFIEAVIESHFDTARGYIEGLQDGMGTDYIFFFSSEWGIVSETFSELIKEWISLGHRLHHVILEQELFAKLENALAKKDKGALLNSSSLKSYKKVKSACFNFKFDAYARKYADEIKELILKLPEGVSLENYKPEEKINHDAEGVELYTPAHDYIFHGKGTIRGPIEKVVPIHQLLDDYPLIETEKIVLEF
ncbi:MAG TPA: hypothetical protein PLI53_01775 [Geobacteraceae bacterium]|nr:hypothetical protein [Geobacteraceae bacterium]